MKNNLYCISFISFLVMGIFITLLSVLSFDETLGRLVVESYYKTSNAKNTVLSIYFSDFESDSEKLTETYLNFLEEYDLNTYYNTLDMDGVESIVFTYSNDQEYLKGLYTKFGRVNDLKEFDIYSTNANKDEQRLINYLSNNIRTIRPIMNGNSPLYNAKDFHIITANDMAYFENDSDNLIDLINQEFSSYGVVVENFDIEHQPVTQNKIHLIFIASLSILLSIILLNALFSHSKEISLYKLEGKTSGLIYFENVLYPILFSILFSLLLNALFYKYILNINIEIGRYYILTFILYSVVSIGIILGLSFIGLLYIKHINVNMSIKGKLPMDVLAFSADFIKIVVMMFLFINSSNFFDSSKSLYIQIKNRTEYIEHFKDRYIIRKFKPGHQFIFDEMTTSAILKDLDQYDSFKADFAEVPDTVYVMSIDENFLYKFNTEFHADAIYSSSEFNRDTEKIIFDNYLNKFNKIIQVKDFPLYSLEKGYAGEDGYIDLPIVYVLEKPSIIGTTFYYQGTKDEAQSILDNILLDYNIEPPYIISSFYENAERLFDLSLNNFVTVSLLELTLISLYVLISSVEKKLYRVIFEKEDMLEKLEGILILKSLRHAFYVSIFLFFVVLLLNLIFKFTTILLSVALIIMFIVIDVLISNWHLGKVRL